MAAIGMHWLLPPRIGRRTYFLQFVLPAFLTMLAAAIIAPPLAFDRYFLFALLALTPGWLFFSVGRCHDLGRSGTFLFILLIPTIGPLWLYGELCFRRGAKGMNRFGPSPV